MVAHSGELFGFDCLITLYPEMNIGIYTAGNGPGGEQSFIGHQLLHYIASDLLLGLEPWLTPQVIAIIDFWNYTLHSDLKQFF